MFSASRSPHSPTQPNPSGRLYIGFRSQEGNPVVCVGEGGRYRLLNAIPGGGPRPDLDWASERGAAPLALSLLLDATGGERELSFRLREPFRRHILRHLPWEGFRLRYDFLRLWIENFAWEPSIPD